MDDEAGIRRIARLSLASIGGMSVLEAESAEEAVAKARAEQPDAILLDVIMPGSDGPATLAALRAEPATSSIPVVFLTAKTREDEVAGLIALGAAGVLAKPFDPMKLAAELRGILVGRS